MSRQEMLARVQRAIFFVLWHDDVKALWLNLNAAARAESKTEAEQEQPPETRARASTKWRVPSSPWRPLPSLALSFPFPSSPLLVPTHVIHPHLSFSPIYPSILFLSIYRNLSMFNYFYLSLPVSHLALHSAHKRFKEDDEQWI